jgi:hypothetical protein
MGEKADILGFRVLEDTLAGDAATLPCGNETFNGLSTKSGLSC